MALCWHTPRIFLVLRVQLYSPASVATTHFSFFYEKQKKSSGRRRGFKDSNGHSLQVDAIAGIPRLKVIVKVVSRGHDPSGEPVIGYDVLDRLGVRPPRRRALVSEADPREMVLLRTTLDRIRFMNGNGRKTDFGRNDMMFRELYGGPPPGGLPPAPGAAREAELRALALKRLMQRRKQAGSRDGVTGTGD